MSIPNYLKPQVLLEQNLINTPSTGAPSLNALIIGPQYDLYRYGVPAEAALMHGTQFVYSNTPGATQVIAYEGLSNNANYIVDPDFVKLYGENLEGQLWTTSGALAISSLGTATGTNDPNYDIQLVSLANPNMVRVTYKVPTITFTTTGSTPSIAIASSPTIVWPASVTPTKGGFSITNPPSTTNGGITITGGTGTAASLSAVVNGAGVITNITVNSGGTYSVPPSSITITAVPVGVNIGSATPVLGQGLAGALEGRPVQSGDLVYTTVNGIQTRRTVASVMPEVVPAFYGSVTSGVTQNNSQFYASSSNPSTSQAAYTQPTAQALTSGTSPGQAHSGAIETGVLTISAGGTGYDINNPPSTANGGITVTGGTGAVGTAVVNSSGVITGVNFTAGGSGYTTSSYVRFAAPGMFGATAPSGFYVANQGVGVTVTTLTLGTAPIAATTLTSGTIISITLSSPVGIGYDIHNPPSTANGGIAVGVAGTGVVLVATVNTNGQVSGISVVNGGTGCTTSTTLTFLSPTAMRVTALQNYLLDNGCSYNGQLGDRFTLTVTQSGTLTTSSAGTTLFSIRTASGQYSANNVPLVNYNGANTAPASITMANALFSTDLVISTDLTTAALVTPIGSGYDTNNPPSTGNGGLVITTGGGTGGSLQATVNNEGQITGFTAIAAGSGYAVTDSIAFVAPTGYNAIEILPSSAAGYQVKVINTGTLYVGQSFSFTLNGAYAPLTLGNSTATNNDIQIVSGSSYAGPSNTTYTITVLDGGSVSGTAVVKVSDTAGIDLTSSVTVTTGTPFLLGSFGLYANFNSGGITFSSGSYQGANLKAGDVYYINAVASSNSGVPSIFVLNGAAGNTTGWTTTTPYNSGGTGYYVDIDYRVAFSGLISQQGETGTWNYYVGTAAQGGVLLPSEFQIYVPGRNYGYQWVSVQNSPYGLLFTSWRGLVPPQANTPIQLWNDASAIAAQFGVFDPDNTLGYAAGVALAGSQGKEIYIASVPTNDSPGWTSTLLKCQRVAGAYSLAPQTHDATLLQLVVAHIEACSTDTAKNWRRGYFPIANPGSYALLVNDANGNPLTATVTAQNGQNIRVVAAEGTFVQSGVVPGDYFYTNYSSSPWGEVTDAYGNVLVAAAAPTYTEYVVASVVSDTELILTSGPNAPISTPQAFQLWKADNNLSQIDYVIGIAEAYSNRRVAGIWCDNPTILNTAGVLTNVDLTYICAEIAGLRSALYPQQGLTNTQILAASNAPLMFTKYSENDLNTAASNGVWIIAQDAPGGVLYIRHQLTTDVAGGILAWEDSVGTNIDAMCYDIAALQEPYIGRRNVTNATVDELETDMASYLNGAKQSPSGLTEIGPQLVNWVNLTVGLDPNFADRINVSVIAVVPTPLNVITTTLNATTASAANIATVSASSTTANS